MDLQGLCLSDRIGSGGRRAYGCGDRLSDGIGQSLSLGDLGLYGLVSRCGGGRSDGLGRDIGSWHAGTGRRGNDTA